MRNRMGVDASDDVESGGSTVEDAPLYDSEKAWKGDKSIRSYYLFLKAYASSFLLDNRSRAQGTERQAYSPRLEGPVFANEHSSFRVIGYEIGWMSPTLQYAYCAGGVIIFLVLYGILQEHVVMNKFHRSLGWFITFLQLGGYGVFAALLDSFVGSHKKEGKIPMYMYVVLGLLQVLMQGFTNLSMHYLNYPAKTMFKSSRVIMTMLFGVAFMGKSYQLVNYVVGCCIVCGLTLCVVADAETSPEFSFTGLVLIMLALCADAAILNIQEYCLNRYHVTHDELIYYSFTWAAVLAFGMSLLSGEFMEGFRFLGTDGTIQVLGLFVLFTLAGFLGMSCLAALTKRFGALKSAVTSTVRKGVTLILSYMIFPEGKAFTLLHAVGTAVFLSGLFLESTTKLKKDHKYDNPNFTSEEDEEIGIITGNLNEAEMMLPIVVNEAESPTTMHSAKSMCAYPSPLDNSTGTIRGGICLDLPPLSGDGSALGGSYIMSSDFSSPNSSPIVVHSPVKIDYKSSRSSSIVSSTSENCLTAHVHWNGSKSEI